MSRTPMLAETEFWKTKGWRLFNPSNKTDPETMPVDHEGVIRVFCEDCGKKCRKQVRVWARGETRCKDCAEKHKAEGVAGKRGTRVGRNPKLAETEFWIEKGHRLYHPRNKVDPTRVGADSNYEVRVFCEDCGKVIEKKIKVWAGKGSTLCRDCARKRREEKQADKTPSQLSPSLWEAYPWQMIRLWDWKRNAKAPWEARCRSTENVWLVCPGCGRSFERTPKTFRKGMKGKKKQCECPYCSGKTIIPGETDLCSTHPELVKEWHPTKNGDLRPEMFTAHSHRKVWWMDEEGNEIYASIRGRAKYGTPIAERREAHLHGLLEDERPDLYAQARPEDNPGIDLESLGGASRQEIVWAGDCGHKWRAPVKSRTIMGSGCPYCSGQKPLVGFNTLSTLNPQVASEWHPTLNGSLTPDDVTAQSNKTAWWLCPKCGEPYKKRINRRTNPTGGSGCPLCDDHSSSLERETSNTLDELGMLYVRERRFPTCMSIMPLPWDFAVYVPVSDSALMLQAVIECQGGQHYKPVKLFGGKEAFARRQKHDAVKREWAKSNRIIFLELRHDETTLTRRKKLKGLFSTLEADPAAHCLEVGC